MHMRTRQYRAAVNLLKSNEFINQFIIFNDNLFGNCVQTFPIKDRHDHTHTTPQPI